jgi:type III pantothenate kinase
LNLVIDIGNTRTKVAFFEEEMMIKSYPTDMLHQSDIKKIKADYNIENAIFSSVRDDSKPVFDHLKKAFDFVIELTHKTKLPIENLYETPKTLGKDRIAAAVGANKLYPDSDILIIDAGTAITYDFINKKNQYEGGYITPGLNMRFKALNHFTKKLPLLTTSQPLESIKGNNTVNSIIGGIQHGIKGEIEHIISIFAQKSSNLYIILTGGDTNYFEKLLKNHTFVAHEITLSGLNYILNYNKKNK